MFSWQAQAVAGVIFKRKVKNHVDTVFETPGTNLWLLYSDFSHRKKKKKKEKGQRVFNFLELDSFAGFSYKINQIFQDRKERKINLKKSKSLS